MELCNTQDAIAATVVRGANNNEELHAAGVYHIECVGPNGEVKWNDVAYNVIPNQGKNSMLDTYFAGSAYTAAFKMSLITAGTAISTSTYAVPTVTETTSGVIAARLAMSWSAASVGSKSATTTSFSIIGTATITGNMVVIGPTTVGDTASGTGVLVSAAAFSAGSKSVSSGDTLNCTYSVSI